MNLQLSERYIKLILKGFTLWNGEIYVSRPFLIFLGMKDTFNSLISQSKSAKNGRWLVHKCNSRLYFKLLSIPDFTRKRLGLNIPLDYLKDLLASCGQCNDPKFMEQIKAEAYLMLSKEISNYQTYLPNVYGICATTDERQMLAVNFAILKVLFQYVEKYPKGLIEFFYNILKNDNLGKHSIPVGSMNYFYKYIKRAKRQGLPSALINGNAGKPSNNLSLTQTMKDLIIYLKTYGNYTSCGEIENNIRRLAADKKFSSKITIVSESTIRNFLATKEADNLTLLVRQGYAKFEEKIIGYLPLARTKNPLSKILIDGYVVQIKCEGDDAEPIKMILFTIMDSFSGHVVMEFGDTEDYHLLARTFEKFLRFTGYKLPREIISDMHSSRQSTRFNVFREYLKENGVTWIASKNPRRKAQLERWFGTLQQRYLSKISGYVGEGIKSKRKDAHPSEEVLFIVSSKEFIKNKNELIRLLLEAGKDYNQNAYFKDAASPLDLYHLKKPTQYYQLQDYHVPYFFWDKHEVSIRGSMIIIRNTLRGKSKKWFYRSTDFDFALKNGHEIDAYHNVNDDRYLYLFERGTVNYLTIIEKQLLANEALADQTKVDKKIIADFGISKAKLHSAFVNRLEEIDESLKNTFGVDPSQLRLEADFKKKADDYEGYRSGISQKTKEPDLHRPHTYRKGRSAVKKLVRKSKHGSFKIKDTLG